MGRRKRMSEDELIDVITDEWAKFRGPARQQMMADHFALYWAIAWLTARREAKRMLETRR